MWVKICGIRSCETAVALSQMGVDAIGLNFYPKSRRYIQPEIAQQIVQVLPLGVEAIGLFVNQSAKDVHVICQQTGIQTVQLHGDETIDQMQELCSLDDYKIIRVFRSPERGELLRIAFQKEIDSLVGSSIPIRAILVDAYVAGEFGGTGQTTCWDDWLPELRGEDHFPLILAGGLLPENVSEAIETVQPWGVDVAGGVEAEQGIKDLERCKAFIQKCKKNESLKRKKNNG